MTPDQLSAYLEYDSTTGNLIWKARPIDGFRTKRSWASWNGRYPGSVAGAMVFRAHGSIPTGIALAIMGIRMMAHRVIWEMHHGPIPEGLFVDHRNGNPLDNKLSNLRIATVIQNNQNAKLRNDNGTGLKGVRRNHHCFVADIKHNGKRVYLGSFPTKGLAAVARAKAAIRYHGHFTRLT